MLAILNRRSRGLQIAASLLTLVAFAGFSRADIFQWEYINPDDPSQGKRQSMTLAPDGAGVDAVPGANLNNRDLTMGYFIGSDLHGAVFDLGTLTNSDFSQANLTNASFQETNLTGADFNGAEVRGVTFFRTYDYGAGKFVGGITLPQLYSTNSYQTKDLTAR